MARYTCSYRIAVPSEYLQALYIDLLQSCHLDVIYYTPDYIMAREAPGQIPFGKLVTVEVLIDKSTATESETTTNIVIKNEELPFHADNHCRQTFELIREAVEYNRQWHLVESVAG